MSAKMSVKTLPLKNNPTKAIIPSTAKMSAATANGSVLAGGTYPVVLSILCKVFCLGIIFKWLSAIISAYRFFVALEERKTGHLKCSRITHLVLDHTLV